MPPPSFSLVWASSSPEGRRLGSCMQVSILPSLRLFEGKPLQCSGAPCGLSLHFLSAAHAAYSCKLDGAMVSERERVAFTLDDMAVRLQ
eukprot:scaffold56191_cov16-Tisochrysis_lutea.AAC.1